MVLFWGDGGNVVVVVVVEVLLGRMCCVLLLVIGYCGIINDGEEVYNTTINLPGGRE